MAPIKKRTSIRAKAASKAVPSTSTPSTTTSSTSAFPSSLAKSSGIDKRARQKQKHAAFVTRIEKSAPGTKKRRRPNKQLKTQLQGLADALPELDEDDVWEGISGDEGMDGASSQGLGQGAGQGGEGGGEGMLAALDGLASQFRVVKRKSVQGLGATKEGEGKMKMKTLKSRPGAAKRKAKMEKGEMERFGRNLAQMVPAATPAAGGGNGEKAGATSDRWKALRGFIGQTMEQNAAFRNAK